MKDRDRLIELLREARERYIYTDEQADHLLANGVIVPPCKVGDKVYYISMVGNIIENEITHIGSYCEGQYYGEQHGIKVPLLTSTFLLDSDNCYHSYEEAEQALKECEEK